MSADNFLGIVKIEDQFNTLYCGYNCWSECQDECLKCGKIALFAVNTIEEAMSNVNYELNHGTYEYGIRFNNFKFDDRSKRNMEENTCTNCHSFNFADFWAGFEFCPICGTKREIKTNITQECQVSLVKSKHSDGYYVSVNHNGKSILALGLDDKSKTLIRSNKYTFEKPDGAVVSFNIFKKG